MRTDKSGISRRGFLGVIYALAEETTGKLKDHLQKFRTELYKTS